MHARETPVSATFCFDLVSVRVLNERDDCPNPKSVRVPRAYGDQSIHAQTIISFLFY